MEGVDKPDRVEENTFGGWRERVREMSVDRADIHLSAAISFLDTVPDSRVCVFTKG